jgi:hypothetical protein
MYRKAILNRRWTNLRDSPSNGPKTTSVNQQGGELVTLERREWMTKFGLRSIVYHETVPGHHFDLALGVENKDLPAFRRLSILGAVPRVPRGGVCPDVRPFGGQIGPDKRGLAGEVEARLAVIRSRHDRLEFPRVTAESEASTLRDASTPHRRKRRQSA